MTHRSTWKRREHDAARLFGARRQRCSGSSGREDCSRSDSTHAVHFLETKLRQHHDAVGPPTREPGRQPPRQHRHPPGDLRAAPGHHRRGGPGVGRDIPRSGNGESGWTRWRITRGIDRLLHKSTRRLPQIPEARGPLRRTCGASWRRGHHNPAVADYRELRPRRACGAPAGSLIPSPRRSLPR
jgi:hypothetical protein